MSSGRRFNLFLNIVLIVGAILTFVLFGSIKAQPQDEFDFKVDFIDVGQGDSVLVSFDINKQILVDGGPDSGITDKLRAKMPPYDRTIEYVILTHPHADHLTGLVAILDHYQVEKIIETSAESSSFVYKMWQKKVEDKKIPVEIVDSRRIENFGSGAQGEFFWPDGNIDGLSLNDTSIVMKFSMDGGKIMFMGDAEQETQGKVLDGGRDFESQIVKIAHHGSENGFLDELMEKIQPKYAVISVGKNSFGHPASSVIEALEKLSIEVLETIKEGAIEFGWNGSEFIRQK